MCYIYELTIDGEITGALYEFIELGEVVFHNWSTDKIEVFKNKNVFEKQFYDNEIPYFLQQVSTLFR